MASNDTCKQVKKNPFSDICLMFKNEFIVNCLKFWTFCKLQWYWAALLTMQILVLNIIWNLSFAYDIYSGPFY